MALVAFLVLDDERAAGHLDDGSVPVSVVWTGTVSSS
jgi:hypothetical protein